MFVANVRHTVAARPRPAGGRFQCRHAVTAFAVAAAMTTLALAAVSPVWAQDDWRGDWRRSPAVDRAGSASQGPVEVSIRVNGRGIPLYQGADWQDRWYLEAKEEANYDVTVRNLTGERVGFVIAVDGLNAINGLRSHEGADEPMYVLDPYAVTTVKGWRKNMGNVSKFVFVDERSSYAARTDQANGDLGWIRVVAFNEDRPLSWGGGRMRSLFRDGGSPNPATPAPPVDRTLRGEANGMAPQSQDRVGRADDMAPLTERNEAKSSPGTGWGDNQRDRVREVDFRPQSYAAGQVILRYEYRDALQRLGILPWNQRGRGRLWERENGQLGFAQPPRH